MPLHDWADEGWWENFHSFWLFRLATALRPLLPPGYRVYVGSYSRTGLTTAARPDLGVAEPVRMSPPTNGVVTGTNEAGRPAPDGEVALTEVEPWRAVYVQYHAMIVAAVEIVSPANKDRPSSRAESTARYAGYLRGGINLMVIDVLPKPYGYSFAEAIEGDIRLADQPPLPTPSAAVYRVGERTGAGGSYVAFWRRSLAVGQPLPMLPLPLSVHSEVMVDLEATYAAAAEDAYLP